jgi:hypothetical protein
VGLLIVLDPTISPRRGSPYDLHHVLLDFTDFCGSLDGRVSRRLDDLHHGEPLGYHVG